jgi:hypothetical protein
MSVVDPELLPGIDVAFVAQAVIAGDQPRGNAETGADLDEEIPALHRVLKTPAAKHGLSGFRFCVLFRLRRRER